MSFTDAKLATAVIIKPHCYSDNRRERLLEASSQQDQIITGNWPGESTGASCISVRANSICMSGNLRDNRDTSPIGSRTWYLPGTAAAVVAPVKKERDTWQTKDPPLLPLAHFSRVLAEQVAANRFTLTATSLFSSPVLFFREDIRFPCFLFSSVCMSFIYFKGQKKISR